MILAIELEHNGVGVSINGEMMIATWQTNIAMENNHVNREKSTTHVPCSIDTLKYRRLISGFWWIWGNPIFKKKMTRIDYSDLFRI